MMVHCVRKYTGMVVCLRWRGGGSPYGTVKDGDEVTAEEHLRPTGFRSGSVRVSGVWIRARKLEGELDVGGRRIL